MKPNILVLALHIQNSLSTPRCHPRPGTHPRSCCQTSHTHACILGGPAIPPKGRRQARPLTTPPLVAIETQLAAVAAPTSSQPTAAPNPSQPIADLKHSQPPAAVPAYRYTIASHTTATDTATANIFGNAAGIWKVTVHTFGESSAASGLRSSGATDRLRKAGAAQQQRGRRDRGGSVGRCMLGSACAVSVVGRAAKGAISVGGSFDRHRRWSLWKGLWWWWCCKCRADVRGHILGVFPGVLSFNPGPRRNHGSLACMRAQQLA